MRRDNVVDGAGRPCGVRLGVDGPDRPGLRLLVTAGGRFLLRQGERVVLLGRVDRDRSGVAIHRPGGYASPLPPLRAAGMRDAPHPDSGGWYGHWAHRFAGWLAEASTTPLHTGPWLLRCWRPRAYTWRGDLVRTWPAAYLDWTAGWNGVIPLRPLSPDDAARVRAYRKHARDGTLAPVLLWEVSGVDGHLVLDGHDRVVAALAEGVTPPTLELARSQDPRRIEANLRAATARHEEVMSALRHREESDDVGARRQRDAVVRGFASLSATEPLRTERTRAWPLPGGAPGWRALARSHAPGWPDRQP